MTDNLLEGGDPDTPQIDPDKNYLEELVGDKKKFKSTEDLARGKFESDSYIKILERRLDEMREDYTKMREENVTTKRLEDVVRQLAQHPQDQEPSVPPVSQPSVDLKQIESLISSKMQEHDMSRQQAQNFNQVREKLRERFGSNFQTHVKNKLDDLGVSEEDLNALARRSPKMVLNLLDVERQPQQESFRSPPTSSQRTDRFSPTAGPESERTWSYYKKLKQENHDAWTDRKIAVQMQEDAIRLGDKFYDGDFYKKGLHEP
jgi:inhibitor of KinA sporulation pathway (predicted exonuclease)